MSCHPRSYCVQLLCWECSGYIKAFTHTDIGSQPIVWIIHKKKYGHTPCFVPPATIFLFLCFFGLIASHNRGDATASRRILLFLPIGIWRKKSASTGICIALQTRSSITIQQIWQKNNISTYALCHTRELASRHIQNRGNNIDMDRWRNMLLVPCSSRHCKYSTVTGRLHGVCSVVVFLE